MTVSDDDALLDASLDKLDDLFFVFTTEGEYRKWNATFTEVTGYTDEEMATLHPNDLIAPDYRDAVGDAIERAIEEHASQTIEADLLTKDGEHIPYEFVGSPIENEDELVAIADVGRDVTERLEHLEELGALADEIQQLSMPIVEVWAGILLSTIVGRLDSDRAERFTEKLLQKIVECQSEVVIIDISEVSILDTHTAQHLIDTIQAVRLLGSEIVITGVKPEISQTLVRLGIGLDVESRATLSDGLETALDWSEATIDQ